MIGITMITAIRMLGMMIEGILHHITTTAVVGTTTKVLLEEEGVAITTMRGDIMKKIMMIE